MKDEGKPPYLPFRSFLTALDQLAQAVPTQIKKEVFPYHSGALQGQLIGALRFLDLIDGDGFPKGQRLEKLSVEKDISSRRVNLRPLLKSAYADVLKLDLAKMTPSQLDSAFEQYGVSGDTKKKAKTFFIKAVLFTGLPLSPLLTRRTRSPTSGTRKKNAARNVRITEAELKGNVDDDQSALSAAKTIELKNGATLTIILKGNLFDLDGEDREFIFRIMDHLRSRSELSKELSV